MALTFDEDCPIENLGWKQCLRVSKGDCPMLDIKKDLRKIMSYSREVMHALVHNIREDLCFSYVALSLHVRCYEGSLQHMWIVYTHGGH